jgi:NAD(P)-dependent dehydrogenase (short-subunit alcohol dehydrogenase family)
MGRLEGKVALITGAGSGIGRETAILFALEGAKVVCSEIQQTAGEETVRLIENKTHSQGNAIYIKTDVSKASDVENAIHCTELHFGKLDIFFNNAGIMHPEDGDALTTEESVWDLTMNINVKGVWYGCKYAIPAMRRAGGGSIINSASFVALLGAASPQLAYTSSKGAVLAMTRELAVVHARENIRFNALCPGVIRTPLLGTLLSDEAKRERRLIHVPIGRFGEPVEQARAALFLASDDSSYVTGTAFSVDGGLTAAYITAEGDTQSRPPVSLWQ